MAKKDRNGNRKSREERNKRKFPELGYYLIVTDTEATERCYFEGMHKMLPKDIKNKIVIKVVETKTKSLISKCKELTSYEAQYRIPWIVFDRDQVKDFDEIIQKAEKQEINVAWSNPCFEIWLFAYFGNMPFMENSWTCCSEFGRIYEAKTKQKYAKSNEKIYEKLRIIGDENKAIEIAEQKIHQTSKKGVTIPSMMYSCTTVHNLVSEINKKIN